MLVEVILINSKTSSIYCISNRGKLQKDVLWFTNIKLGVFISEYVYIYREMQGERNSQNISTMIIFEFVRYKLVLVSFAFLFLLLF